LPFAFCLVFFRPKRKAKGKSDPNPGLLQRIHYAEEFEFLKVAVSSADLNDAMFPHHRCDMKIMHPIARHARVFTSQIAHNIALRATSDHEKPDRG
jgi:hypothetical protein